MGQEAYWLNRMAEFWQKVADEQLRGSSLRLLLMNTLEPTPQILQELLARIDRPGVRLALDVASVTMFSDLPLGQVARYTDRRTRLCASIPSSGVIDDATANR